MTGSRKRIVIVDDSDAACDMFREILVERYGAERVAVETYITPIHALPKIDDTIDLLIRPRLARILDERFPPDPTRIN